ncbi:hypothetical protein BN1723_002625 [Verticillium longisporum]|uniref:Uncharacterized protein n=1 Tax=Verticillium longisporum TaxID=100787 RepID=A0A0G4LF33_VERLO|nr:hypothetical protein BN1723_002625 [Verticillium longisporum]
MDEAYQQHSHHARRKNRSSTNLNHLTLAPLTTKLPLDDDAYAEYPPPPHTTSYLQGKSAPTTPGLLTRSPVQSRSHSRQASAAAAAGRTHLPKSKSASHLAFPLDEDALRRSKRSAREAASGTASPVHTRRRQKNDYPPQDDSGDWLLRAGVALSSEAREYKGQTWLTSRASSTSLAGGRDAEEEAFEREVARERELAIRQGSRRGSGSSATLGLVKVRDNCEKIQRFGKKEKEDGSPLLDEKVCLEKIAETLKTLETDYADVEQVLKQYFEGRAAAN